MKNTTVTRKVVIPDILRVSRCEKAPESGPRLLFFSGGTALNETSRVLKKFTHNSIHLITPFDSGGSSAILRNTFDMPAIGDLRSRLMSLADETISGHPEILQLFASRLSKTAKRKELVSQLTNLANGKDARVSIINNPMRKLICNHLAFFLKSMPEKFDLRGASIGNLILTAGYLNNKHQLDPVIFLFSKLVNVQGQVAPVVNDKLQLAVKLEDGKEIIGQHLITGKVETPIKKPIKDFYLVKNHKETKPVDAVLSRKMRKLITEADLICFPPGSFYSSIAASLLPIGVGRAIATNRCPKVYVPSLGKDPETIGMSLEHQVFKLLEILKRDVSKKCTTDKLINFLLIDSQNTKLLKASSHTVIENQGITIIDTRLVTEKSKPYYDPQLLAMALLSLT